jgi:membrane protein implicated in regulation of membrane protease activity
MRRLLLAICIFAPVFLFMSLAEAAFATSITAVHGLSILLLVISLIGLVLIGLVVYRRRARMQEPHYL